MKSKVFVESFKGSNVFSVWEVDDSDNKIGQYPLVSLGEKKATSLMRHIEDFIEYAEKSRSNLERKVR